VPAAIDSKSLLGVDSMKFRSSGSWSTIPIWRAIVTTAEPVDDRAGGRSAVAADTPNPPAEAKAFRDFFTQRFPKLRLEDFVNGPYSMNEDMHRQWEEKEQFPPYEFSVDMGKEMFSKPFKTGKSYADCFANGGIGVRQNFPYFDAKEGKVITLELALNRCREANGEAPLSYVKDEMAALTAYMAFTSRGKPFDIKIPDDPRALEAYQNGKRYFYTRRGQLNFSCATCHVQSPGERIRAERFIVQRADGEERILEINIAPLLDDQRRQIGIVSAFRDVTESIRVEQRIRQALDTMLHVAEAVSGITDNRVILQSVLERTLTTLNCQRGAIHLFDEERHKFLPLLSIGFTPNTERRWLEDQQIWLDPSPDQYHGFCEQLVSGHAALINADQCPQQPNTLGNINVLAAPIKHNYHVHGLLLLDRSFDADQEEQHSTHEMQEHHEFSIWDIAVLDGIAQLAGLAVEQAHWQQEAANARTSEEALRQANELKDEFLAITAHEFRSPLTIILAQSQLVARNLTRLAKHVQDNDMIDRAVKNLAVIEEQARQLTGIVKTFLEVTYINRGQLSLDKARVNLADIVRQVVEQHDTTSEQHPIRCEIQPDERTYTVIGDSARLQQVIANLVENAIKYSPFGGTVTVRLRYSISDSGQSLVEVCVEDKGIGIPPEFQARLFERFYRAPGNLETKPKGIGLGLYIVAQLIQMQGGTIHVESSGEVGEGSRFIFALPALESSSNE